MHQNDIQLKYPDVRLDDLPQHVAIIMDGNGRWAKKQGKPRVFGHKNGVKSVRAVSECAAELGIKYLTLYAFSTENWRRPKYEVNMLMSLLVQTIHQEVTTLNKNNIRLQAIGNLDGLPEKTRKALLEGIEKTKDNTRMTLILALNYSARWELTQAVQNISHDTLEGTLTPDAINDAVFENYLSTKGIPDPEILIRTSGEHRISNFLLWQIAYTELFFLPIFWPEFGANHFIQVIKEFQNRERRYGMTSEQLKK